MKSKMRWKILNKTPVFEWIAKLWKINLVFEKFNQTFSDQCDWYFIEKNDAVAIILFDKSTQKILLVRQFRLIAEFFPDDQTAHWPLELVAGAVKKGENLIKAAQRECLEETGIKINELKLITHIFPSPAILGEKITIYYADIDSKNISLTPKGVKKENEDLLPEIISLNNALSMIKNGQINDAKTVIAILWLKANL